MIALLLALAAPHAAYMVNRDLTPREIRQLERYARRLCGPEGYNDYSESPDANGRYRLKPSCERNGWNGYRYVGERG
jgi:hypothetical protein